MSSLTAPGIQFVFLSRRKGEVPASSLTLTKRTAVVLVVTCKNATSASHDSFRRLLPVLSSHLLPELVACCSFSARIPPQPPVISVLHWSRGAEASFVGDGVLRVPQPRRPRQDSAAGVQRRRRRPAGCQVIDHQVTLCDTRPPQR